MKFNEPFLFLNDKLSQIDEQIILANFSDAKIIINEVLDIAPGMKIELPNGGELSNSGAVHWRKLLAETECKNDEELLYKGKMLDQYPTFYNAMNYASNIEKEKYLRIEEQKKQILAELLKTLKKRELDEKQEKKPDVFLTDFQEELNTLTMHVQENILKLEEIERKIQEQSIDYMAVVGEYENSFGTILSKVNDVGYKNDAISLEERDHWIDQLEEWLMRVGHEANNLEEVKTNNVYYLEYSKLKSQQETIVSEIETSLSKIKALQLKVEGVLTEVKKIADEYAEVVLALERGNYEAAKKLITPEFFNEIVKQAMTEKRDNKNGK